jgi:alpha-tubulin suppressor-like RCC1 family protein
VSGLSDAVDVSAGINHGLALKRDGTVWSWGQNNSGQLGSSPSTTPRNTPEQVDGISTVTKVDSSGVDDSEIEGSGEADSGGVDETAVEGGGGHSLALKSDGTVWSWDSNVQGQLGRSTGSSFFDHKPGQVSGLAEVVAVQAGQTHSLALKSDGTVWAWGNGNNGQLGIPGRHGGNVPRQIESLPKVKAIHAGQLHSLAIDNEGRVWGWGLNNQGQLGNGSTTFVIRTPVQVSGLTGVKKVVGGVLHTLAIQENGTGSAWGQNSQGQLGDGTTTNSRIPVQVKDLTGAIDIAATNASSHAIKADGSAWSWGFNNVGQLGDATTSTSKLTPVKVSGLGGIMKISAGSGHILALAAVYERDGGILQPINEDNSSVFSRGKAVPIKFKLKGDEPDGFDPSQFTLKKQKVSCTSFDAEGQEVESVPDNPSESFRYDPTDDQYIINADFRSEVTGTCWKALVYLNDGSDPLTSGIFKLQK